MDKQNVAYTYNGILLSLNMEGNSDTWYKMNNVMILSETTPSQKHKYYIIPYTYMKSVVQ